MSPMKALSQEQKATIASFTCVRLKDANLSSMALKRFTNSKNEELVNYLRKEAIDDDRHS